LLSEESVASQPLNHNNNRKDEDRFSDYRCFMFVIERSRAGQRIITNAGELSLFVALEVG